MSTEKRKSILISAELVEEFKEACAIKRTTMVEEIRWFMVGFIKGVKG